MNLLSPACCLALLLGCNVVDQVQEGIDTACGLARCDAGTTHDVDAGSGSCAHVFATAGEEQNVTAAAECAGDGEDGNSCWVHPCELTDAERSIYPGGRPGLLQCSEGSSGSRPCKVEGEIDSPSELVDGFQGPLSAPAESGHGPTLYHSNATFVACEQQTVQEVNGSVDCPARFQEVPQPSGRDFEDDMAIALLEECPYPPATQWRYRTVENVFDNTTKEKGRLRIADALCPLGESPGAAVVYEWKCYNPFAVPGPSRQTYFKWQAADYAAKINFARCALAQSKRLNRDDDEVFGGLTNGSNRYYGVHLVYGFCLNQPDWTAPILNDVLASSYLPASCESMDGVRSQLQINDGLAADVPEGELLTTPVCEYGYAADQDEEGNETPVYFEQTDQDIRCTGTLVPDGAEEQDCASEHYDRCRGAEYCRNANPEYCC